MGSPMRERRTVVNTGNRPCCDNGRERVASPLPSKKMQNSNLKSLTYLFPGTGDCRMTTRITLCLGSRALSGLCGSSIARGEPSRQLHCFQDEPIDSLIRQIEPGLAFSVGLRGESDEAFVERCQVVNSGPLWSLATNLCPRFYPVGNSIHRARGSVRPTW